MVMLIVYKYIFFYITVLIIQFYDIGMYEKDARK